MKQKDKEAVIAALEELKGDSTGIIAATIEDCQRVVREMKAAIGGVYQAKCDAVHRVTKYERYR